MVGTIEVFACEMLGKDPVPEAEDALPLLIALGNPHLVHSVHAVTSEFRNQRNSMHLGPAR